MLSSAPVLPFPTVPDSLSSSVFTQAISDRLCISPCHCLIGFPLHPSIAFSLMRLALTAHSDFLASLLCLSDVKPTCWIDITPSLPRTTFCRYVSTPVGKEENIPRPSRSFLFLAPTHCLPPSLFIVSIQYTYSFSPCGMRFIPVCRFFVRLLPLACSNPSCSIFSMPADSYSCAFAYLCRHCLLCPVRHCFYCHTLHSPHFYFAKVGQASCCKGHIPCLPRKSFKDFGVQLLLSPNSLRP